LCFKANIILNVVCNSFITFFISTGVAICESDDPQALANWTLNWSGVLNVQTALVLDDEEARLLRRKEWRTLLPKLMLLLLPTNECERILIFQNAGHF
jgi:hypothetical protein